MHENRTMTIEQNSHFVKLSDRQISFWHKLKSVEWRYSFEDNCRYVLHNAEHQLNWNKVGGISFGTLAKPDMNSAMVGWRYDTKANEINIAPYFNIDGAYIMAKEPSQWLSLQPGTYFTSSIVSDYESKKCTLTVSIDGGASVSRTVEFKKKFKNSKQINFYFGGTDPAPNTVTIQIQLLNQNPKGTKVPHI